MIARIIHFSIANRVLVLFAAVVLAIWGTWAVKNTPVDALPDLSDVQVIVRTNFPGQAPQIVENQVTYPLTTTMLSVPGVKAVRGYSFFGDSFVYIIFDEHTDLYWARSRVLEYLNQIQGRMPTNAKSSLGQMLQVLVGFTNMLWLIQQGNMISHNCEAYKTGF